VLRRRRLEEAASKERSAREMFAQEQTDRQLAEDLRMRAGKLRDLARQPGWFGSKERTRAQELIEGVEPGRATGRGPRAGKLSAIADRMDQQADTLVKAADKTKPAAGTLHDAAVLAAADVGVTPERALIEDGWPPEQKAAEAAATVAADVDTTTAARADQAEKDRVTLEEARTAVEAIRDEVELRAQMTDDQRRLFDRLRQMAADSRERERINAQTHRTGPTPGTAAGTRQQHTHPKPEPVRHKGVH
jgi:hypothetical protein